MSVLDKLKFWRGLGLMLNTGLGAKVAGATGGIINAASATMAPRLKGDVPFVKPAKPLAESRIALITTAGFHLEDQEPFDVDAVNGDPSFREFPSDVDLKRLRITHAHYTHRYAEKDANVILPLTRLHELKQEGVLKDLAPRVFSFGFAGTLTKALIKEPDGSAWQIAGKLKEDQVDLALIVPA